MQPGSSYLFVGPTLHRGLACKLSLPTDDVIVLPPAKRGDMQRLASEQPPGIAIIVDGYFHLHNLAIGHAELRDAIAAGWRVWGLSSMGAIRAAELRTLGMRGFGRVYEHYAGDPTFRDDEVALLHEPEPPYRSFSEPLVHVRALLAAMVDAGAISTTSRDEIIATLMPMWFGDRTATLLETLIDPAWVRRLDEFQTKSQDLAAFLASRPYRAA